MRRFRLAALFGAFSITPAAAAAAGLPAGLSSPDHGVVCNSRRGACFDRFGPSIGLTEAFLGPGAAQALTAILRDMPPDQRATAEFSPGDNVTCRREAGPCRIGGVVDAALTAVLYGPRPAGSRGAEASAVIGVEWKWLASRYNNHAEARPADPVLYRLRLEPDGSLRARVDCNQAGGRYRIDGSALAIELTHSTLAACEPGSLDQNFRRDLGAVAIYFVRKGKLYLELKHDSGTMEFGR